MCSARLEEAVESIDRAVELSPVAAWTGIQGGLYGLVGASDNAKSILRDLEQRSAEGHVCNFWLATVHSGLGDLDTAFSLLECAREDRDPTLLYLFAAPRVFGWRDDPRFAGLLRSVGLGHLVAEL